MKSPIENTTPPATSLANKADPEHEVRETVEPVPSPGAEMETARDDKNTEESNNLVPEASPIPPPDTEQLNDVQKTLQLVSAGIGQINEGLGEIAAAVKDIKDSVTSRTRDRSRSRGYYPSRERSRAREEEEEQEKEEEEKKEEIPVRFPTPAKIIPKSRLCNWAEFKNNFSEEDAGYCVEALLAGDSLRQERDQEYDERDDVQIALLASGLPKAAYSCHDHSDRQGEPWIQQVRVQSEAVIGLLNGFNDSSRDWSVWSAKPMIFTRPFRYFIHYQPEMKKELQKLEDAVATSIGKAEMKTDTAGKDGVENSPSGEVAAEARPVEPSNSEGDGGNVDEDSSAQEDLEESKRKLEEVRCYVDFVDEHIMPLRQQFDIPDAAKPQRVRHQDLWYLFKVGDLVYVPQLKQSSIKEPTPGSAGTSAAQQTIWRTYRIQIPLDKGAAESCGCCFEKVEGKIVLHCYYIDYDGESYGAVTRKFEIQRFDDEREVTKLPLYPVRFAKDASEVLESARSDGDKFMIHIREKYGSHAGWTLLDDPQGKPVENINSQGEKITLVPEHVESDVVFDFKEAFNCYPSWKPVFNRESAISIRDAVLRDDCDYLKWSDESRSKKLATYWDYFVETDAVCNIEFNELLEQDQYLVQRNTSGPPSKDDLALLPKRLFGYALWERKFVVVSVRNVERKLDEDEDNPFNKLQINEGHKKMIQAIISSHFANKSLEDHASTTMTQDIIRGKGKGVVILLHGVPGVGKTATAEAVAHKWEKPLFPITCGDLGYTATTVEKTLNDIFRLAHLWGCVLLLDEADVFITQRTKSDLKRNALVSVFLRMLEYYNGVLFLTTNRPGVLDEAVKSRVHLSLRYEALTLEQTRAIFQINIDRLKKIEEHRSKAEAIKIKKEGGQGAPSRQLYIHEKAILKFAEDHYKSSNEDLGRWNGRQIRNAFSIAASLAHFESDDNPGLPRALTAEQFRTVQEATILYDQYRASVLGDTDGHIAESREERYDEFSPTDFGKPQPSRRQSQGMGAHRSEFSGPRSFANGYDKPTPGAMQIPVARRGVGGGRPPPPRGFGGQMNYGTSPQSMGGFGADGSDQGHPAHMDEGYEGGRYAADNYRNANNGYEL